MKTNVLQRTTTATPTQTASTRRDPTGVPAKRASTEMAFHAPVRLSELS